MLVLCDYEKRGPLGVVLQVEVDIVVLGERIKVREIHLQEILRLKESEGCHRAYSDADSQRLLKSTVVLWMGGSPFQGTCEEE